MKFVICIIISSLIISCNSGYNDEVRDLNATIYFTSEPKPEEFSLTFSESKDSIYFRYVSKVDSNKTIDVRKSKVNDTLIIWFDKFVIYNQRTFSDVEIDNKKFKFYGELDPAVDGTGPILFNEEFGILGIHNVNGPTIIFLEETNMELAEKIKEVLYRY